MSIKASIRFKRGVRRPRSDCGLFRLKTVTLPECQANILGYLMALRKSLIGDLRPTEIELSVAQFVLINRITSKLGMVHSTEHHGCEILVMVGNDLAPSLGISYLAHDNAFRLGLQALGIGRKADAILSPYEIVERINQFKETTNEYH